ncbi:MAG: transcription elongation factor GreAB [Nevskiaceae bacterium]|nr:MAG: transcription elongation factor GreAB [Nevskiaceae bacterium]
MSRAFVKEPDGDTPDELPELPLSPHPNRVTARGLAQLQQRLAEATRQLQDPATGAHERALTARDARWLQQRIASASVVQPSPCGNAAGFGTCVTFVDEAGTQQRYRIVGEDEADPLQGRVSWVSPLARALEGAQVGDLVHWPRPAGVSEIEVLVIDNAPETAHD